MTTCRSRRFGTSSSPSSAPVVDLGGAGGTDEPQRLLQLASPLGVGGVLETPWDAGVDDQERGVRRNADQPVLERVAVEQDRALVGSEQARRLVEDPARNAHGPQLRPLAEEGELERLELEVGDGAERERERHLEGGGRREPRSGREVGRDRARQADRGPTCVGELGGHRLRVSRPSPSARAASVGGDGLRSPVPLGLERDLPLRANGCEPDPVLDRDGQDEPAAVVGVLADEVDPPRRPDAELRLTTVNEHPIPSRSHWIAAPLVKRGPLDGELPACPGATAAAVLRTPLGAGLVVVSDVDEDEAASSYVAFACPYAKHSCPKSAAYYSPATPAMRTIHSE